MKKVVIFPNTFSFPTPENRGPSPVRGLRWSDFSTAEAMTVAEAMRAGYRPQGKMFVQDSKLDNFIDAEGRQWNGIDLFVEVVRNEQKPLGLCFLISPVGEYYYFLNYSAFLTEAEFLAETTRIPAEVVGVRDESRRATLVLKNNLAPVHRDGSVHGKDGLVATAEAGERGTLAKVWQRGSGAALYYYPPMAGEKKIEVYRSHYGNEGVIHRADAVRLGVVLGETEETIGVEIA